MANDPNLGLSMGKCPNCDRIAFTMLRRTVPKLAAPGRTGQPVVRLERVECPWCRTISEPYKAADGQTIWKVAVVEPAEIRLDPIEGGLEAVAAET